jgi:hypothetical protein
VLRQLWKLLKKTFRRKKRISRRRVRRSATSRRKKEPAPLKKKIKKRSAAKKAPGAHHRREERATLAGTVTHYFPKVNAAVIQCKKSLSIGEPIWIKGATTNIRQTVGSMQIDRKPIDRARAGQEIGLEVFKEVRPGDNVYIVKG